MKKKISTRKKYATGGTALKVPTIQEDLFNANRMYQESQIEAATNPLVTGMNMAGDFLVNTGANLIQSGVGEHFANTNPTSMFGKFMKNNAGNILGNGIKTTNMLKKAYGGNASNVPVEVEGEEVGQMPNGEMLDFQGPSHEQGGIPIALPEGTEIYSKRVKVDGVSMADRKKKREKKTYTLEQLLDKNKSDILLKNSLARTNKTNEIENNADTKIQQTVSDLLGQQEQNGLYKHYYDPVVGQHFPGPENAKLNLQKLKRFHDSIGIKPTDKGYGTTFGPRSKKAYNTGKYESVWDEEGQTQIPSIVNNFGNRDMLQPLEFPVSKTAYQKSIDDDFDRFKKSATNFSFDKDKSDEKPNVLNNILNNVTMGDALGMFGNAYQAHNVMNNIKQNRAGDTPNINAFKDFGKDGLAKMDESKQYLKQRESNALAELNLNRNASVSRNRGSSRSVNGMRALDLATDSSINSEQNKIYDSTSNAMMNILGQESQLMNNRDGQVMQGEQARDLADRQDRDNFFNQMQQGFINNGKMISQTGHDLNDIKKRNVNNKLVNFMSKAMTTDSNGNTVMKPGFDIQEYFKLKSSQDIYDEEDMPPGDIRKLKALQAKQLAVEKKANLAQQSNRGR